MQQSTTGRTVLCGLIVAASVLLFAVSLTQESFYVRDKSWGKGYWILLIGWLGFLDHMYAWFANPVLVFTWLIMWSKTLRFVSFGCALLAICLSLSFLLQHDFLINEAGHRGEITGCGYGYWLWIASISVVVLGNVILILMPKNQPVDSRQLHR